MKSVKPVGFGWRKGIALILIIALVLNLAFVALRLYSITVFWIVLLSVILISWIAGYMNTQKKKA